MTVQVLVPLILAAVLAVYLGISQRQTRQQCAKWVEQGFLTIENPSNKARSYRLAQRFEKGLI